MAAISKLTRPRSNTLRPGIVTPAAVLAANRCSQSSGYQNCIAALAVGKASSWLHNVLVKRTESTMRAQENRRKRDQGGRLVAMAMVCTWGGCGSEGLSPNKRLKYCTCFLGGWTGVVDAAALQALGKIAETSAAQHPLAMAIAKGYESGHQTIVSGLTPIMLRPHIQNIC